MEHVYANLHYVMTLLNPYLFGEFCLHDATYAKEALKIICKKWLVPQLHMP
jgi:hypothetical protein